MKMTLHFNYANHIFWIIIMYIMIQVKSVEHGENLVGEIKVLWPKDKK